jgi:signal recognition particle receptor subunit beta
MVQINFAQKQVNAKIVYYGPGMSGKTTNLEVVHQRAPTANRGDLTSISTDGDRTLFFDFMPLDLGTVAGMRTCFQIYTVPGQVYYNSTRKLVLQGVDGVVFVADSSAAMVQENLESLKNLEQNLNEYGKSLATLPHIIQFNKRDLPDAMPVEELNRLLNAHAAPCFEAVANSGQGVFPTLKALAARVLETIHTGSRGSSPQPSGAPLPSPAPAPSASGTAYTARPLSQTGYAAGVAKPAAPAPATIPMPTRPGLAAAAQAPLPKIQHRAPAQTSADPNSRTAFHAPPAPAIAAQGQAPIPMQSISMSAAAPQQVVHAHGAPAPGMVSAPPSAPSASLQMMRSDPSAHISPVAPARPRAPAPARPIARPSSARTTSARVPGPISASSESGQKKQFTTLMLVLAALIAGAVMAVAVLS